MDYQLTLIERPGYLHAKVTGANEPGNVLRFLGESYEACNRQG